MTNSSEPPKMDEKTYIKERLEDQIDWYGNKSTYNKRWFTRLKIIEFVITAFIPIFSLALENQSSLRIAVGVLGAVVLILQSVHGLSNYQELWIEYRAVSETLKHEKYMYLTQSGIYSDGDSESRFKLLVSRCENIISHENINWIQSQKSHSKEEKNAKTN